MRESQKPAPLLLGAGKAILMAGSAHGTEEFRQLSRQLGLQSARWPNKWPNQSPLLLPLLTFPRAY